MNHERRVQFVPRQVEESFVLGALAERCQRAAQIVLGRHYARGVYSDVHSERLLIGGDRPL